MWGDEDGVPFKKAAESMKSQIESSDGFNHKCDKVSISIIKNFPDVQDALRSNSDIREIHFFVHSGPGILFLDMKSTKPESNISVEGGKHNIHDYTTGGRLKEPVIFNSRGVSELHNSNMKKPEKGKFFEKNKVYIHGCKSREIAFALGLHFKAEYQGVSGTCYYPTVDEEPTPASGEHYFWLKITGQSE